MLLSREPEVAPNRQLETALTLLGEGRDQTARRIATALQEKGYQDSVFPGGVPFVLGICAFAKPPTMTTLTRDQRYVTAVSFLREAERLSLTDDTPAGMGLRHRNQPLPDRPRRRGPAEAGRSGGNVSTGQARSDALADAGPHGRSHETQYGEALEAEYPARRRRDAEDRPIATTPGCSAPRSCFRSISGRNPTKPSPRCRRKVRAIRASAILRAQTMMADGKLREALKALGPVVARRGARTGLSGPGAVSDGGLFRTIGRARKCRGLLSADGRTVRTVARGAGGAAGRRGGPAKAGPQRGSPRKLRPRSALGVAAQQLSQSLGQPEETAGDGRDDGWNAWMEHHYLRRGDHAGRHDEPGIPREQALELSARANQRCGAAPRGRGRQGYRSSASPPRRRRSRTALASLGTGLRPAGGEPSVVGRSLQGLVDQRRRFHQGPRFRERRRQAEPVHRRTDFEPAPGGAGTARPVFHEHRPFRRALRDFQEAIANNPTDPAGFPGPVSRSGNAISSATKSSRPS